MEAYINSIGLISPQKTYDGSFLEEVNNYGEENHFSAIEPAYKEFINPVQLRRMSRILKMGLGSSSICINNLPEKVLDAIIVGTGLACISDLEKFLFSMREYNEEALSPIPFINSSHNTVAAQIAMQHKITGYNNTYCHRGSSFEYALLDAMMLLNEQEAKNVLVGGIDEYSEDYKNIFQIKDDKLGEGASFFILSNENNENTYAKLKGVHSFHNPYDKEEVSAHISRFLNKHQLTPKEIDILITGKNENPANDDIYSILESDFSFHKTEVIPYKHLCGEYMTSTGFALWLASCILKSQYIPPTFSDLKNQLSFYQHILIYNHYNHINHSLFLLEKV